MEKLLDKISSYNIFNYLFPGVVFSVVSQRLEIAYIPVEGLLLQIFWFYFVGLIISRVGSIVVAPLCLRIGFVIYSPYNEFLEAQNQDSSLPLMVEITNMYRTLMAAFMLIGLGLILTNLVECFSVNKKISEIICLLAIFILFAFSFRKQATFVKKRVEHYKRDYK